VRVRGLKQIFPGWRIEYVRLVAPSAGAWIETRSPLLLPGSAYPSHPVRVRGLKQPPLHQASLPDYVAPSAGAWIETTKTPGIPALSGVAPSAGAWIETQ